MSDPNQVQDTANENPMVSPLDMPDEDVANLDLSFLEDESVEESEESVPQGDSPEEDTASEADETEDDNESDEIEGGDPEDLASEDTTTDEVDEPADEADTEDEPDSDKEKQEESTVNYESEYKKLLAPFKANGKEMQVDSVDDAIQLMQMGANYNKNMAAFKPHRKMLKVLENNNLLDEAKLSYLIDLDKKKPEAITKLIKESGIDLRDIDVDAESDYKPETYTVDDKELALDEVIETIKDSPTYNKTIEVVATKWDGTSKQAVADNPQLLSVINDHMASGVYELINNEIEKEHVFGRLTGLSDLEAYRQIGDAIQARNGFDHLFANQQQRQAPTQKRITPKTKPIDPNLKSKKRAASSTKANPTQNREEGINPLSLSDDEFEKLGLNKFL